MGRDTICWLYFYSGSNFNPPSPCGEGHKQWNHLLFAFLFQSTLPVWGGTTMAEFARISDLFQSTLPVWGGTRIPRPLTQIHSEFQSTLPVWGGTYLTVSRSHPVDISIHPPRVGRDKPIIRHCCKFRHFNPPSPCGEGRYIAMWEVRGCPDFNPPSPCGEGQDGATITGNVTLFQSTLPVWGGTRSVGISSFCSSISIHPPRVGRDGIAMAFPAED